MLISFVTLWLITVISDFGMIYGTVRQEVTVLVFLSEAGIFWDTDIEYSVIRLLMKTAIDGCSL